MSATRTEEDIFLAALEIESLPERTSYLVAACGDDLRLRERVEKLLLRHEEPQGMLDAPPPGLAATGHTADIHEKPGTIIGPYRLLEQIGEGGFGVVFLAEQVRPVRRRVALKIIKPGMDTRQVIARFEAERQVLAMMDHPGIAKVFDAGTVGAASRAAQESVHQESPESPARLAGPTGRPYFVMELVQGVPITEYCDECNLTTGERLELFISVCQAVNHAHGKGVIHRDLKPNNVLVAMQDGRPMAKIIDFGVAKALNERFTDHTLVTGFAQMLGTPMYMSPEQAELSPLGVDTRSDIYSLGVMLYELLVGTVPFDRERLNVAPHDELRRIIREEEPPRPSDRVSTLDAELATTAAEQRRTDRRRLKQHLRGELDWIVMKCLDKDPNRRYATASALAEDVQRHLDDEPIKARPPSPAYRFRKFARRHKTSIATFVLASALITSAALIVGQRNEARTQRRLAATLAQQSRQRFYAADMKLASKSWVTGDKGEALELLERYRPKPGADDLRSFGWHYLWGQVGIAQSNAPMLRGHAGQVYFVTYSPEGTRLATASEDGTIRVWDAAEGETLFILRGHEGEVTGVSFSPDGMRLASAGSDRTVRVWSAADGRELAILRGHTDTVFNAVFSPDGKLLASAGSDKVVRLWDAARGIELATLPGHIDDIEHLAFSPDGRLLATAGGEHNNPDPPSIKLWDVADRREIATLRGHGNDVYFVAFSPDGSKLASASADRTVRTWDVASAAEGHMMRGHASDVHAVAFSPDGKTLASASRDGTVRLWDSSTGRLLRGVVDHPGCIWSLAFSSDGRQLATAGSDGIVRRWSLARSALPTHYRLPIQTEALGAIALASDGKWLATIDKGNGRGVAGQIWDAVHGTAVLRFPQDARLASEALAFSPSSRMLAYCVEGNLIELCEVPSGRKLLSVPRRTAAQCVAICPGDRLVATSSGMLADAAAAEIWQASSGELHAHMDAGTQRVLDLAFSPDGRTLAGLAEDDLDDAADIYLWDTERGELRATLSEAGLAGNYNSAAFSPDGRTLATVAYITVQLWDTETHALRANLAGHELSVLCCAFSPDGRTLATASDDCTVRLWHVATGQELLTLEGHTGPVRYVGFYPDGRRLLSASTGADDRGEFFVWPAAEFESPPAGSLQQH